MKLSKAKELIKNGTHCIIHDEYKHFSEELLQLSNSKWNANKSRYNIYISEITDDDEIQFQIWQNENWTDYVGKYRVKPKPDFSKELEALKENIMKVIVTFENNL